MKTQQEILLMIEEKRQQYIDAALDIWDYAEPIFEEKGRRLAWPSTWSRRASTLPLGLQICQRPLWPSGETGCQLSDIWESTTLCLV